MIEIISSFLVKIGHFLTIAHSFISTRKYFDENIKISQIFTNVWLSNKSPCQISATLWRLSWSLKSNWNCPIKFLINSNGDCFKYFFLNFTRKFILNFRIFISNYISFSQRNFISKTFTISIAHVRIQLMLSKRLY